MKRNITKFFIALLFVAIGFSSCDKVNDITKGTLGTGQGSVTASYTGSLNGSYESVNMASLTSKTPVMISITGNTTSLPVRTFMIVIPTDTKVGNHKIIDEDKGWAFSYINNFSDAVNDTWVAPLENEAPDFYVNITKYTTTEIEGTFTGTLYNTKTPSKTIKITNGAFKGKF